MELLNNIIRKFTNDCQFSSQTENFENAEIKYTTKSITIPEEAEISSCFQNLYSADEAIISIKIAEGEAMSYSSVGKNFVDFAAQIAAQLRVKDNDDEIVIGVKVNKTESYCIAIYDINVFAEYIQGLDLIQMLSTFESQLSSNQFLIFRCCGLTEIIETKTIYFTPFEKEEIPDIKTKEYRETRYKAISSSVHSSSYKLIPEDFIFTKTNSGYPKLNIAFEKCSFILIIASLFDITSICSDSIYFKLNGYKTIEGTFLKSYPIRTLKEYKLIYEWVYTEGNLIDKLGLARNIISLNFDNVITLSLKESTYNSIISGYKIYQKQNISQYIEIRNKISEQLLDFNKRATLIVDSFASGFQKNSLVVMTFFSTLVGIKFLSSSTLSFTFSLNALILSLIFVSISTIYLFISRKDTIEQMTRFSSSYDSMKKRYTDLLTPEDIEKILNKNTEHTADLKFITDKLRWYTKIWIATLSFVLLAAICLFVSGAYECVRDMTQTVIYGIIASFK